MESFRSKPFFNEKHCKIVNKKINKMMIRDSLVLIFNSIKNNTNF